MAENRGLLRDAACLYKRASAHGDPGVAVPLFRPLHTVHPGDPHPANWAAAHISLDRPYDVLMLLQRLREAGAAGEVTTLASRVAAHVSLDDPSTVVILLRELREAGATGQVTTLASRAAAHAPSTARTPWPFC